jgi:hypothetical protein
MNSVDVAANCDKNTSDHVLEVGLDEKHLLVQGSFVVITLDGKI